MSETKFEVKAGEKIIGDEKSVQPTKLFRDGRVVASSEALLGSDFFGVHWWSVLPIEKQIELIEKCLAAYEANFSEGAPTVAGNLEDLKAIDEKPNIMKHGTIIFTHDGDIEHQLVRPLNWEQIRGKFDPALIDMVRINTLAGDFFSYLKTDEGEENFGFLSHMAQVDILAQLMAESSQDIPLAWAKTLLETVVGYFGEEN